MKIIRYFKIIFLFIFISSFILSASLCAQTDTDAIDSLYVNEVSMVEGELSTITVYSLTRLSLVDPGVVDIISADDKKILLVARRPGQTTLFLWDEHGKRQMVIYVYAQSLDFTRARLERLFESANIKEVTLTVNEREGKIVVSGNLPEDKKGKFDQIIGPFGNEVINLVAVAKVEDMVQVDMQITELKETLSKTLGVDWPNKVVLAETPPKFDDGTISDLFKIGDFARSTVLSAEINALLDEGKARILSQPRLVVISGQEASFLVGGEIPIRTSTTSDGGVIQESVTFKPYGVSMTITPTIIENKVDIILSINVSEVDTSTASAVSESVAFSTRTASTRLNLEDGQLIILAGLIKRNHSEAVSKVPFLGDIPILGLLFRSKSSPAEADQELVISLRPHILTKGKISGESQEGKIPDKAAAMTAQEPLEVSEEAALEPSGIEGQITTTEEETSIQDVSQPAPDTIPTAMLEYAQLIQQKISQAIQYPKEALEYGWEGTVKIGLLILKDGSLALASIKESSGFEIFDENALSTAKNAAPYSNFPSGIGLQELSITIPIVYSLVNN